VSRSAIKHDEVLSHRLDHLESTLEPARDHATLAGAKLGESAGLVMQPHHAFQNEEVLVLAFGEHDAPATDLAGPEADAQVALRGFVDRPGMA